MLIMGKGKNMHFKFNSNNLRDTLDFMLDCLTPRNPCLNLSKSQNSKGSKGFAKYKKALASDCKQIDNDFTKALSKFHCHKS